MLDFILSVSYVFIFIIVGAFSLTYIKSLLINNYPAIGLSSAGGAIGSIIGICLYSTTHKKHINAFLTTYILPLPLAYGIAKLGCFSVGCCYGIYYSGIGHISYNYSQNAPNNVGLFPVQLLEVVLNMCIYIYLMFKFSNNKNYTVLIADCITYTGLCKFITDFFRFSHYGIFLSLNQYICLFFVILGIIIYILKIKLNVKLNAVTQI